MSDYISEDIWYLILMGLPVNYLLRFRCVCKTWKHIIDSRSFILDNLAIQDPVLLVQNIRPQNPKHQYFVLDPDDLQLLGGFAIPDEVQTIVNHPVNSEDEETHEYRLAAVSTVHGVICLYDSENRLFLWNPAIRRLLRLPVPEPSDAAHFLYDPDLFYYKCCGFWIDPYTTDFKIVIFFFLERKYSIFNSSNQAWTEMDIDALRLTEGSWEMTNDSPMVLVEGLGYWMLNDDSGEGIVFHFDFVQEISGTIELPGVGEEEVAYSDCVTKWQDYYLAIIHWQYKHPADCSLWVLDNELWVRMFQWTVYDTLEYPIFVTGDFDYVLLQRDEGDLVPYYPQDFNEYPDYNPYSRGWHRVACDFVESLVFPNLDGP